MAPQTTTAESLIHDVQNYYGVHADIMQATVYLSSTEHPTPGGFRDWLGNRK